MHWPRWPTIKLWNLMGSLLNSLKKNWLTISPLFIRLLFQIKHNSKIPLHINTALISVVLKPGKDPTLPSSNRRLSLINTKIKIISKALATIIETVTPIIIHPVQTGFIKGWHSSNNMRKLFNWINVNNQQRLKAIITCRMQKRALTKLTGDLYSQHYKNVVLENCLFTG